MIRSVVALASLVPIWGAMACGCSSEPYDLEPGDSDRFVLAGDEPWIEAAAGDVAIEDVQPLGGGLALVTLHCSESSTEDCTGILHGC